MILDVVFRSTQLLVLCSYGEKLGESSLTSVIAVVPLFLKFCKGSVSALFIFDRFSPGPSSWFACSGAVFAACNINGQVQEVHSCG